MTEITRENYPDVPLNRCCGQPAILEHDEPKWGIVDTSDGDGVIQWEESYECHNHTVICSHCGKTLDVPDDLIDRSVAAQEARQ